MFPVWLSAITLFISAIGKFDFSTVDEIIIWTLKEIKLNVLCFLTNNTSLRELDEYLKVLGKSWNLSARCFLLLFVLSYNLHIILAPRLFSSRGELNLDIQMITAGSRLIRKLKCSRPCYTGNKFLLTSSPTEILKISKQ
jgi:hypothetical protein